MAKTMPNDRRDYIGFPRPVTFEKLLQFKKNGVLSFQTKLVLFMKVKLVGIRYIMALLMLFS